MKVFTFLVDEFEKARNEKYGTMDAPTNYANINAININDIRKNLNS
jgi:hypothetical protein